MFKPIQFPSEIEPLVRFVEETDPALIVEETLAKLRNGTSADDMIRASALAIVRSTDLPPNHHGGPVHPISGVHAVRSVSQRLPGELSYLPIVQHTTLCNNHCHSLLMGPYLMTEIRPREGSIGDVDTHHISDVALRAMTQPEDASTDSVATTVAAFQKSLVAMQPSAAQHYFLWLIEHLSPGELLDLLMPIAISRNNLDDHNFIYPVYTARALEAIGWEWATVLFRHVHCHAIERLQRRQAQLGKRCREGLVVDAAYRVLETGAAGQSARRQRNAGAAPEREKTRNQSDYSQNSHNSIP